MHSSIGCLIWRNILTSMRCEDKKVWFTKMKLANFCWSGTTGLQMIVHRLVLRSSVILIQTFWRDMKLSFRQRFYFRSRRELIGIHSWYVVVVDDSLFNYLFINCVFIYLVCCACIYWFISVLDYLFRSPIVKGFMIIIVYFLINMLVSYVRLFTLWYWNYPNYWLWSIYFLPSAIEKP